MATGLPDIDVSTHTLRRSGASELSRLGLPWADVMAFGRWNTDRAAREYVRRGEVALYRCRHGWSGALLQRAEFWTARASLSWTIRLLIEELGLGELPLDVTCTQLLSQVILSYC